MGRIFDACVLHSVEIAIAIRHDGPLQFQENSFLELFTSSRFLPHGGISWLRVARFNSRGIYSVRDGAPRFTSVDLIRGKFERGDLDTIDDPSGLHAQSRISLALVRSPNSR